MCRFLDSITANIKTLQLWPVDEWERSILALDADMLAGEALKKIVAKPSTDPEEVGDATTSKARVTMDKRVLRACTQNAVALDVVFMQDQENRFDLEAIIGLAAPIKARQGKLNSLFREPDKADMYWVDISTGEFFTHLHSIMGTLLSPSFLDNCHFSTAVAVDAFNDLLAAEEERAGLAGQFALSLIICRLVRMLDRLEGWPNKLRGVLKSPQFAARIFAEFDLDITIFDDLTDHVARNRPLKQLKRHVMNLVAVRQWMAGWLLCGRVQHQKLFDLARRRCKALPSSVLEEEKFKVMKVDKEMKGSRGYRKPAMVMARVLQQKVIGDRFISWCEL
jgi:hypothetical protein